MAAIDRVQLVADAKVYLPTSNTLSDAILTSLADNVVDFQITADDEAYYSEALCKLLKAAALLNQANYSVDVAGNKKEKVGDVEIEKFSGTSRDVWAQYLKNLPNICPYLPGGGYRGLSTAIGIKINPSDAIVINDCTSTSDDTFL